MKQPAEHVSNTLTLDKSHIEEVERGIAPPMKLAVTIPTSHEGIVVYIAASAFYGVGDDAADHQATLAKKIKALAASLCASSAELETLLTATLNLTLWKAVCDVLDLPVTSTLGEITSKINALKGAVLV